MSLFQEKMYQAKRKEVLAFLQEHKEGYDFFKYLQLTRFLESSQLLDDEFYLDPEILELFSKYDIYYRNRDHYVYFYNLLKSKGFLEKNCMEVGSGPYPRLSELVLPYLNRMKHQLTIYEPALVISKLGNAKLVKEPFTKKTSLEGIDTLFAMFPHEPTIDMIEKALEENKNLALAFCGCEHFHKDYPLGDGDCWGDDCCKILKEKYGKEIEVTNWPKQYRFTMPIITRKKK